jgi:hypothetical protein
VHGRPVRAVVLAAYPFGLYLDVVGAVLPVVTSDAVPLPSALLLTEPSGRVGWGVEPGATVPVGEGRVGLPGLDLVATRVWRPARVRRSRAGASSPEVAPHVAPQTTPQPTTADDEVSRAWVVEDRRWLADGIRDAVCAPDPEAPVRGLLGRGSGLTPSGDDALAGALLVAHALGLGVALAAVVRRRLGATTAVSAALLSAAADGFAARSVVTLVDAAVAGDALGVRAALPAVLSIGHSSGADLVVGVGAALEARGCTAALPSLLAVLPRVEHPASAASTITPPASSTIGHTAPSIRTGRSAA